MKGKFGTLVKKIQSSPLEDLMEIVSDIAEILMNYLVCVSIVTAVSCGFKGENAPLLYWVVPLAMPLYCWFLRRKARQLSMFIVLHFPAAVALVAVAFLYRQNQWFWILAYFLIAVVYIINSLVVRVKEKTEDSMPMMLAMIFALLMFFVGAYMESDVTCQRIIYLTLGYAFLWMMRSYAQFFYNYLYTNKSSAAVIPEKSILRLSLRNALLFSILGVSAVGILVASPISAWMTAQVKEFGLLLVKAFIYLLMLVAGTGEEEPPVVENETPPMDASNLVGALGTSDASLFALILEKVLFFVAFVFIFIAITYLIIVIVRYMINGFYDKQDLKKEVVSEGFVEEEERLSRKKEDRQRHLPVFGGTPEQKVRKIFWKLVLTEYESRSKEKPNAALTARQFAGQLDDGSKTAQWEELAALYEKARYSSKSVSKEESRQASVLARKIKK